MSRPKPLSFAFVFLLLLVAEAFAATGFDQEAVKSLSGRNVLVLVGPESTTKAQKIHFLDLVRKAGADPTRYQVYQTVDLPNETKGKLGLRKRGPEYAVLVRWGNPARFGPAQVLEPGVVTALTTDADIFVLVEAALLANNEKGLLEKLSADLAALRPRPQLKIEQVDFEANGKPLYLVNTKIRVLNEGKVAAKNVSVSFLVENPDGSWYELGRHSGLEVKAGTALTRDLVRTTHDTPLLNDKKEIQPTKYRIRLEYDGGELESSGEFTPQLLEHQD